MEKIETDREFGDGSLIDLYFMDPLLLTDHGTTFQQIHSYGKEYSFEFAEEISQKYECSLKEGRLLYEMPNSSEYELKKGINQMCSAMIEIEKSGYYISKDN